MREGSVLTDGRRLGVVVDCGERRFSLLWEDSEVWLDSKYSSNNVWETGIVIEVTEDPRGMIKTLKELKYHPGVVIQVGDNKGIISSILDVNNERYITVLWEDGTTGQLSSEDEFDITGQKVNVSWLFDQMGEL